MQLTGDHIGIAILDTGIFLHPDFDNRLVAFYDFVNKKNSPYDDNSHGTHVAGILGGSGKMSKGRYQGVAPKCNLISLKILDSLGNGKKENILSAFSWLTENQQKYGIQIINISVGSTSQSQREEKRLIDAVEYLWDQGFVIVAAAGNRGPRPYSITAPGSSKKIITVGSSDLLTGRYAISGRGPTYECVCKPDLVVPGNQIVSCNVPTRKHPDWYTAKSGTSMSTPIISGAAALLLQRYPHITNYELKKQLLSYTEDLGLPHNQQGRGLFQLERMKKSLLGR